MSRGKKVIPERCCVATQRRPCTSSTVFDALGRVVSEWVGTNDTGATAADPTGGGASGNNMVKIAEYEYDAGGVGDSNLTKATFFPGGSAANRVVQYFYDWRNRLAAEKYGVEREHQRQPAHCLLHL
jgi:hypothetical protein